MTHHHADHTGGVRQLKQKYQCKVHGPANDPVSNLDDSHKDGDLLTLQSIPLTIEVIGVPGHTRGHIAWFIAATAHNENLLFCGDTLFSGGCGRLFEGSAEQMWHSLQKFLALPDNTKIYPAHEYTLSNLRFAATLEPENQKLQQYQQQVALNRQENRPSLPTNLLIEKEINPFLREKSSTVINVIENRLQRSNLTPVEVFEEIRHWKDIF